MKKEFTALQLACVAMRWGFRNFLNQGAIIPAYRVEGLIDLCKPGRHMRAAVLSHVGLELERKQDPPFEYRKHQSPLEMCLDQVIEELESGHLAPRR